MPSIISVSFVIGNMTAVDAVDAFRSDLINELTRRADNVRQHQSKESRVKQSAVLAAEIRQYETLIGFLKAVEIK